MSSHFKDQVLGIYLKKKKCDYLVMKKALLKHSNRDKPYR